MKVAVITFERGEPINSDRHIRKNINWNNSSDRKWLVNHMHYCMLNDRLVALRPESN